jgi:hypothetical protein
MYTTFINIKNFELCPHRVYEYLRVSYDFQNKHRLFSSTLLTDNGFRNGDKICLQRGTSKNLNIA